MNNALSRKRLRKRKQYSLRPRGFFVKSWLLYTSFFNNQVTRAFTEKRFGHILVMEIILFSVTVCMRAYFWKTFLCNFSESLKRFTITWSYTDKLCWLATINTIANIFFHNIECFLTLCVYVWKFRFVANRWTGWKFHRESFITNWQTKRTACQSKGESLHSAWPEQLSQRLYEWKKILC